MTGDPFAVSRAGFESLIVVLGGASTAAIAHGELEEIVDREGREVLRLVVQDHLDHRTAQESRLETVADSAGVVYGTVETAHTRRLVTLFGPVTVQRYAYRHRAKPNLYPADAALNLPTETHSHGLRELAAVEASRGSYAETRDAITRRTGQTPGKRQVEMLAQRAATDFDAFYAQNPVVTAPAGDVLALSVDGKGIVMRPEALRPGTAAAAHTTELTDHPGQLAGGEKRHRKRMTEIGAVFDVTPAPRLPTTILTAHGPKPPVAADTWLTASVVENAATVIADVFRHADRRDPHHTRPWIALVDGNLHQIATIETLAAERGITIPIIVDFCHVMDYLWGAGRCLHPPDDPELRTWVHRKALTVLCGNAEQAATSIRRKANRQHLTRCQRKPADAAATYLTNQAPYLDYPTALAAGWPIGTGVIEGACRYLIADRFDITGARWGLDGAEAILKLRALRANGHFEAYWQYHLKQEQQRLHHDRYANHTTPTAIAA